MSCVFLPGKPNKIIVLNVAGPVLWDVIAQNPAAKDFLINFGKELKLKKEYSKEEIVKDIESNFPKISWNLLSANTEIIDILENEAMKLCSRINFDTFSANPAAVPFLRKNKKLISWKYLSLNPEAIDILKENPSKICYHSLCLNPKGFELLKNDINWKLMSGNPEGGNFIISNCKDPENELDWELISKNPSCLELLEMYPWKIVWESFYLNPNLTFSW